ncbi:MAG: hypothetical protein K0U39_02985 [Alphaproteobacteria bacterium]|nr:hypothetical protein [Alphaproteobacteria bacterium]
MKKEEWVEPTIGEYYDEEDKALIEDIEEAAGQEGYVPVSLLTPELKVMYQRAAARALERRGK